MTIRPGFSGTVPIFNLKSRKKSEVSRDANLSHFCLASRICPDLTCAKWKCEHVAVDKRWVDLFTHFHHCANVLKMVEFCLSLPGTNAENESFLADE